MDPQVSDDLTFPSVESLLAELAEYVAIPSVSRSADVERCASGFVGRGPARLRGRPSETDGFPLVRADWLKRQEPTVLVYGHYDVQPTGGLSEWGSDPFELTVDGDVVRGRGVTDDKGPVLIVLKLAQAFVAQRGGLPLNVKFLIEGEEEIGSPTSPPTCASTPPNSPPTW